MNGGLGLRSQGPTQTAGMKRVCLLRSPVTTAIETPKVPVLQQYLYALTALRFCSFHAGLSGDLRQERLSCHRLRLLSSNITFIPRCGTVARGRARDGFPERSTNVQVSGQEPSPRSNHSDIHCFHRIQEFGLLFNLEYHWTGMLHRQTEH